MRINLFWRTFLLICALVLLSLAAFWQALHYLNPVPAEQRLAWEISSVLNLTRSALISSQGDRRVALLDELAREEGVRVTLLEPTDLTEALPGPGDSGLLEAKLRTLLGPRTQVAGRLNGEPGLWVSFDIDADHYWLGLRLERWKRQAIPPWWVLTGLAMAVSICGALLIGRLIDRPLARLASALRQVGAGSPPPELKEAGPTEIAELNRHFNQMARELAQLESDRAVALAGISHDIRTPLTRLRMEVEMVAIDDADRQSMVNDIERIDQIIGKFVEYARSGSMDEDARVATVDVAALLETLCNAYREKIEAGQLAVELAIQPDVFWTGDSLDLARVMANLIENALRHGHLEHEATHVTIRAMRQAAVPAGRQSSSKHPHDASTSNARSPSTGGALVIEVQDQGPGAPEHELARLLRPFARLDRERNDRGGSGLGLSIVQRIAQRYRGSCTLANAQNGGLLVKLWLPDA